MIYREPPSKRDLTADTFAAAFISKSDIFLDYKTAEQPEVCFRHRTILARIAKLSYMLADLMNEAKHQNKEQ